MSNHTPTELGHYVYRTFTHEGQCLYVGSTNHPKTRINGHLLNSPWYWEAADWEWTGPLDGITAADMERREIWRLNPTHNEIRSTQLREFFEAWTGPSAKALTTRDLADLLGVEATPTVHGRIANGDVKVLTTVGVGHDLRYVIADSEIARLRAMKERVAA